MRDLLVNIAASFIWAILVGAAAWLWQQRKIRRLRARLRAFEIERGSRIATHFLTLSNFVVCTCCLEALTRDKVDRKVSVCDFSPIAAL